MFQRYVGFLWFKNGESGSEAGNRVARPGSGPHDWRGQKQLSVNDHVTGHVFGMSTKAAYPQEFLG